MNSILKNGIDHSYEEKNLEVIFNDEKIELTPKKSNHALSVDVVECFDIVTKQKDWFLFILRVKNLNNSD